ncbi:MAG: hypothetical protein K6C12_06145 [Oscillospiraceae bacterium]|nr:hypothetical protein [Oscillospiraceae bacterium]
MRNPLKSNQKIKLVSVADETAARELVISNLLGIGANIIAYEATDRSGQIRFILKECYPEAGADRQPDGTINWKTPAYENAAKSRMRKAYNTQLKLQNETETENTNTHLVDIIYEANNTLYTITEHKNAVTYNKAEDRNLQETLITARSIARAVKAYHDSGYLHLDIKPQNVMILPETRDLVILLDFDSVTRMDKLADAALSYSPNYAAPEQLQGRVSRICPATDVYAIGAIVYNHIFGRLPDLEDQSIFSAWDYSNNALFTKLSMKIRTLTTEFLRKALSASVKNRYQTMDEVIAALDVMVKESDPDKRFILDAPPICSNIFVGRDAELVQIHEMLQGNNPVFITGMKGIGKTELVKNYARKYRKEYDVIRFVEYNGSLAELITSGELVAIANNTDETITINSFASLVDDRTLLIIDNYRILDGSPSDGKLFDKLASLKCKLLVTTYENAQDLYTTSEWIELGKLNAAEQFSLFEKEYGASLSDRNSKLAEQILKEIKGFTLLIPLIAKLLKSSRHSFDDVYQNISDAGTADIAGKVLHNKDSRIIKGTIGAIVSTVLDLSELPEDERHVLDCLAALKGVRIRREKLLDWIGNEYDDSISALVRNHWINSEGAGKNTLLAMHDIIRDVIRQSKSWEYDTEWIQNPVDEYLEQKKKNKSHTGKPYHPYSYPPFYGGKGINSYKTINAFAYVEWEPIETWEPIEPPKGSMLKLVITLLLAIDPQQEPERLIRNLFSIIKWDLGEACYCSSACDDMLKLIETSETYSSLALNYRLDLHILRLYFALKALCDCDLVAPRNESEVLIIWREAKSHAELALDIINRHASRETAFNIAEGILIGALFTAGFSLGIHLFTTQYPEYSTTALDEYTAFVNQLAQHLKENYPDLIPNDPEKYAYPFDSCLSYFNRCMNPDCEKQIHEEYEEAQFLLSKAEEEYEEAEAKAYAEYCRSSIVDEYGLEGLEWEDRINKLLYDVQELVEQCKQLGYLEVEPPADHPEANAAQLTDKDTLQNAKELLIHAKEKIDEVVNLNSEIDEKYAHHSGAPFHDVRSWQHQWSASACIHASCSGDLVAAKQFYEEYLQTDTLGFGFDFGGFGCPNLNMYNTLKHLGFTEMCAEILRINIQNLENDIIARSEREYSPEEEWLKPKLRELLHAASTMLEYSELLGDENLIAKYNAMVEKYNAMKEELEGPDFVFEE